MRARLITRLLLLFVILSALTQAQVVLTDDANTSSLSPTKNFGGSIALLVGCGSNSYVKFSMANLGPGITSSNVSKATLVLYADFVLTSGTMDVYQVNGSWSESAITWNNAPALGTKLFSAVSVTKTGFLSLDLTSSVQSWLNGTLANNGIALVPSSGSAISVSFDSKENIFTSHSADLDLELVSAGPQGQQGLQGLQGPAGPMGPTGATGPTGQQGMMGLTGMTGATGPAGSQGPAGTAGTNGAGFNFRTAFDNSASYVVNDVVTYNGSSYVATVANHGAGTPDTNPTDWTLMAQQGATGPAGTPGAPGQPGPQGPAGSTGAAGATGPQGPAGPQGIQGMMGLTGMTGATGPAGPLGPTGSQGPAGPQGPAGLAGGISPAAMNAALLRWYSQTFSVGSFPEAVAFDGTNIWVANNGDNTVTKLLASSGAVVGTYSVSSVGPRALAFDGTNIWVANYNGSDVTKLLASTGAVMGLYSVGNAPVAVAFDGTNIWVTRDCCSRSVIKLLASTGAVVGTYPVGNSSEAVAFDGANIWVANEGDNTVTKLLASTGAVVGTYPVGSAPYAVAFDGTNIWVANVGSNNVTEIPVY